VDFEKYEVEVDPELLSKLFDIKSIVSDGYLVDLSGVINSDEDVRVRVTVEIDSVND
jgi:hypothetical protein